MYHLIFAEPYYHVLKVPFLTNTGSKHPAKAIASFRESAWNSSNEYLLQGNDLWRLRGSIPYRIFGPIVASAPSLEAFPILFPELFI